MKSFKILKLIKILMKLIISLLEITVKGVKDYKNIVLHNINIYSQVILFI